MPGCGRRSDAGALRNARRTTRLVRGGCARQARNYFFVCCETFLANGRANDERQPAIIRINRCFEPRLSAPAQQRYQKESAHRAD
jgi:hypothetical protein